MSTSPETTVEIESVVDIGNVQLVTCEARVGAALITTFTCACSRVHDCVVVIPDSGPDHFGPIEAVQRIEEWMGHEVPEDDRQWAINAADAAVLQYLTPAPTARVASDPADIALKDGRLRQEDIPVLAFIRRANPCRSGRISSEFPSADFRAHDARLQRLRRAGLIEHRRGYWWPVAASARAS